MKTSELFLNLELERVKGLENFDIKGLTKDSRKVKEGYIFFITEKNKAYIKEAIERGATLFIAQEDLDIDRPLAVVKDVEAAIGEIASRFYGSPSQKMTIIGITGTNGKTTTSYLLESILKEAQKKVGVIGTINYRFDERIVKPINTTPGAEELQKLLSSMLEAKVETVVMEVSSHALHQKRVEGVDFDFAIFTNITHDHLDYHGNERAYREAKALLFHYYLKKSKKERRVAILNLDDPQVSAFIPSFPCESYFFSLEKKTDAYLSDLKESIDGLKLKISCQGKNTEIESPLIGGFNAQNILAAFLTSSLLGIPEEIIKSGIERLKAVPGRLERIKSRENFYIFVDYAHTPDALKKVLEVLNRVKKGRLILLFGCGGERDRLKRAIMGKIASLLSDFTIITSDNPRHEDPKAIIEEIREGFEGNHYRIIENRKEAIYEALKNLREKDVLLVAGKGHEDYQIIGDEIIPFSDKEVIEELLNVAY